MIEVVRFWSSAFGPLAFLVCALALSPLLVPVLLVIRILVEPRSVSRIACVVACLAAMPYALSEAWLGGPGIVLVLPLIAVCLCASWWAFRQKTVSGMESLPVPDRRWALVMLIPYALIVAVTLSVARKGAHSAKDLLLIIGERPRASTFSVPIRGALREDRPSSLHYAGTNLS